MPKQLGTFAEVLKIKASRSFHFSPRQALIEMNTLSPKTSKKKDKDGEKGGERSTGRRKKKKKRNKQ